MIHKKNESLNVATATPATDKPVLVPSVATVAVAKPTNEKINRDIEKIRSWLFHIGEPVEDHYLVLDKCRNDLDAMDYFLKHARSNFTSGNDGEA